MYIPTKCEPSPPIFPGTEAVNARHGKNYEYGPGGAILYPAAGAEDDWAKSKAGIKYSYTMELRPGYNGCFSLGGGLFLGATKHLYKRVCPSVRPSVRLSVTAFHFPSY